jgi:hypothetical protein
MNIKNKKTTKKMLNDCVKAVFNREYDNKF